jgi:GGDEF domain-containing protein
VPLYAVGQAAALAQERERQALHDPLTGLANRTQLLERALPALAASAGEAPTVALLMVDLDGFKEVNDTHGHLAGDELLRLVGARLAAAVRPADMVARFGGDEFAILLCDLSPDDLGELNPDAADPDPADRGAAITSAGTASPEEVAHHVAARIRQALREPYQIGPLAVSVGASVGTAVAPAGDADVDALLHAADVAMYAVKAARRRRAADMTPDHVTDSEGGGHEGALRQPVESISLVDLEHGSLGAAGMRFPPHRVPSGRRRPRS